MVYVYYTYHITVIQIIFWYLWVVIEIMQLIREVCCLYIDILFGSYLCGKYSLANNVQYDLLSRKYGAVWNGIMWMEGTRQQGGDT